MLKNKIYYAYQLSSLGKKDVLYYANYDNPVFPEEARTYKTGKHGHAKTTVTLVDYFTNKRFVDITNSDTFFYIMEDSPFYELLTLNLTDIKLEKDIYYLVGTEYNFETNAIIEYDNLTLEESLVPNVTEYFNKFKEAGGLKTEGAEIVLKVVKWQPTGKQPLYKVVRFN